MSNAWPPPNAPNAQPRQRSVIPPIHFSRCPGTLLIAAAILVGFAIEVVTGATHDPQRLVPLGANLPSVFATGQYWRFVAAMFLHGDGTPSGNAMHLGFNLLALLQLGSLFETMFGTRRFLFIYFVTGIFASFCSAAHFAVLNTAGSSVGASGAIFGILGAFIFSIRRSPLYGRDAGARSLVPQLLFWIVVNIGIGLRVAGIDLTAHLGGLIAGIVLGLLPHRVPPPPPSNEVVDVVGKPYDG
ncbi:MAG TPA: rhomboid family intramembrane serine protease [Thermoanaerobaculia bacterium]|nr:rhomboid family intramembrane serine protease [Thermoanaerobaculia bacterium]